MAQDALRDGFVRLCLDPSSNTIGAGCRLVLEGQFTATGTDAATADVLRKVTSVRDIDTQFGQGSILAESLKKAISCCGNDAVEVFALPRSDPAGGVAAVYTMTIAATGTNTTVTPNVPNVATSDGRIDVYWGDSQWNISVRVKENDTQDEIAAAIQAAIDPSFPYTATVAANVITLTAKNAGTVGNFLNAEFNWHGRNGYAPESVAVTFAQGTVGTGDMLRLNYDAILGECCVCCWAVLGEGDDWQDGVIDYLDDAWACDKPQCFGHSYQYNSGTLGQILAADTNSATASRLAHCATDPNFPWLKVAAYAAQSCCLTVDNPEISIQGPTFGTLTCVKHPESCQNCWTYDEQEQLRESGFVVTVPVSGGEGALTSPMITNDVTNSRFDAEGRENLTFQSAASRRLATATAVQIAEQLQQFNGLGYYSDGTNIRQGAQGVNRRMMLGTMRAWVKSQVGVLFSEFDNLDADLTITDDFATAPKCAGVPGKMHMNLVYRPPVRITQVVVNAAPKLLSNCD